MFCRSECHFCDRKDAETSIKGAAKGWKNREIEGQTLVINNTKLFFLSLSLSLSFTPSLSRCCDKKMLYFYCPQTSAPALLFLHCCLCLCCCYYCSSFQLLTIRSEKFVFVAPFLFEVRLLASSEATFRDPDFQTARGEF